MLIHVQGIPAVPGTPGVWRAGRFWAAGSATTVEVLGQDEDPPQVKVKGPNGEDRIIPDPNKLGRKSFEALKADPRIRLLADPDSQREISSAAIDEARAAAGKMGARVGELEAENASLKAKIAELEAALEKATAPAGDGKKGGK